MRSGIECGAVVLFAGLFASAVASQEPPGRGLAPHEALSQVVVVDGVTREEAESIASFYFYDFVGIGCGSIGDVVDGGGVWGFPVWVGLAPPREPDGEITVHKTTGSIFWAGHRAAEDPLAMLAAEPSNSAVQPTRAARAAERRR